MLDPVDKTAAKNKLVAVAIDRDKGSQGAMKWAVNYILSKGQSVLLLHVKLRSSGSSNSSPSLPTFRSNPGSNGPVSGEGNAQNNKDLFLPFRVFCTRKDINCQDIVIDETDVVRGLIQYVTESAIEILVVGAGSKGSFLSRFKARDIPGSVSKGVPDFCTVYVISKGKISSTRAASRAAPVSSPLRDQILTQRPSTRSEPEIIPTSSSSSSKVVRRPPMEKSSFSVPGESNFRPTDPNFRSPFSSRNGPNGKPYELSQPKTDLSFVSSGRPSIDRMNPLFDSFETSSTPRLSNFSNFSDLDQGLESFARRSEDGRRSVDGRRSMDTVTPTELSYASMDSDPNLSLSPPTDDLDAEMRRLKVELKQTMDMYSTACKEALSAKQKAMELQRWKMEEEQRLEEARVAEETALALAEREKAKSKAAIEHAEAVQRLAEIESRKRIDAEKGKALTSMAKSDVRYRKYTIEEIEEATEFFAKSRKIGEGGYGPVFKCRLDHTPVAVKVLRPDAAQGRAQFQQEVEILSSIRHPNMVLLLGACPEYGCLVYEYMSNGSLEDRLLQKGNSKPLSWQHRFRIAAEIATGLLFLHQTKPEPLVHRDLKPGNILLDRNFVSKISDVGLARLVPSTVSDDVTQYRMTSTAGTFCYIDPEYQQTGMLGVKSDVYSLGIMYLQVITAKSPMGITHQVERAIENGTFSEILDQSVTDWPIEEALSFAKICLQCAELRRKDRPDLGTVVLPELQRLRELAEDNMSDAMLYATGVSPTYSQASMSQASYPRSGFSSNNNSSAAS
ncbi:U-box domain-containing protein 52-like [Heracleum sosnowskyi]|uniref:RING-type E3 ubiquitin transferase n=1 Tax=Heracleum sosnowskyi TaxID=360622 RepID=A0AAD8HS30_9APIA|nr:U-box domain-containing protein 52-like [Heracleum sosnowskyi]